MKKKNLKKFLNFQVFDSQNCEKNSKNYFNLNKTKFSRLKLSLNKFLQLLTTLTELKLRPKTEKLKPVFLVAMKIF